MRVGKPAGEKEERWKEEEDWKGGAKEIERKNNNKIGELVMFVDEHPEFVFIQIKGDLTLQDIQNITKGKR